MNAEGSIAIRLECVDDAVTDVHIESHRPLGASSMFERREVSSVLQVLPLVFSVCAVAQGCAASRAVARARGVRQDPRLIAATDILLLAETAREHLWRVMIDWPKVRGDAPGSNLQRLGNLVPGFRRAVFKDSDPFLETARPDTDETALFALIDDLRQLLAADVFGAAPSRWLAMQAEAFDDWMHGSAPAARHLSWLADRKWCGVGDAQTAFLAPLSDMDLESRLGSDDAADFIARPTFGGKRRETTVFSRQADSPLVHGLRAIHGAGLLARLAARLVELAEIPDRMLDLYQSGVGFAGHTNSGLPEGTGIAQVRAARGLLVHRVEIEGRRVVSYRILAPTEWNFNDGGIAELGLRNLKGTPEEIELQARLWISAVDPCVAYDLEVD
jgi:hypothetical protein